MFSLTLPSAGLPGAASVGECEHVVEIISEPKPPDAEPEPEPEPEPEMGVLDLLGEPGSLNGDMSEVTISSPSGSQGSGLGGGGSTAGLGGLGNTLGESIIGTADVQGALDVDAVQEVLKWHHNQLRYCYQRELNRSPNLSGSATIRIEIGTDGTVTLAEPLPSPRFSEAVEHCLTARLLRITFPEPTDGNTVTVEAPFTFSNR